MKDETFRVEEIHCDGCENAIRNALGRVDGVVEVTPDQATNEIQVSYDDAAVKRDDIVERLDAAGFPLAQ